MPYVDHDTRDRIDHGHPAQTPGELTYELQQVVQRFLLNQALSSDRGDVRYADLATVLGALEGCKADFIERILMPYEACKAAENGDVWDARLIATNRDVPTFQIVSCFQDRTHLPHDWCNRDVPSTIYHCPGA